MIEITERDVNTHAVRLETDRLVLREHAPGDLNSLHAMLSDPATIWYIPDMYKADIAEVSAYIRDAGRRTEPALPRYPRAAWRKTSAPAGCWKSAASPRRAF